MHRCCLVIKICIIVANGHLRFCPGLKPEVIKACLRPCSQEKVSDTNAITSLLAHPIIDPWYEAQIDKGHSSYKTNGEGHRANSQGLALKAPPLTSSY